MFNAGWLIHLRCSYKNAWTHVKPRSLTVCQHKQTQVSQVKLIKTETETKDYAYLWNHTVEWNNGLPGVGTSDGSLVFYTAILVRLGQQDPVLRNKGRQSNHTYVYLLCARSCTTHTQNACTQTQMHKSWPNHTGPLCSNCSQPDLALPGPP